MKLLYKQGKLTPGQAHFMAPSRPAEELYDLKADPHELNNLADKPRHAAMLNKCRAVLDKWIKATNDNGQTPEDPDEAKRQYDTMVNSHKKKLKTIGVEDGDLEGMVAYWEKVILK